MNITQTAAWKALLAQRARLAPTHLRELFAADPARADAFCLEVDGLLVDFSKQRMDAAVLQALVELARAAEVEKWRDAMVAGEAINVSENRAVLHMALRHAGDVFPTGNSNVMPEVIATRAQMAQVAHTLRAGQWLGFGGQPIRAVVNIGIGGSDLGPKMAVRALRAVAHPTVAVHFVSNLDGAHLAPLLQGLDPRTTLFIVASKTFSTQETLTNAGTARKWLLAHFNDEAAVARHFLAVTSVPERAQHFGVASENIFRMWDWVGGRYSVWSAVGLPLMIAIGVHAFEEFLAGAAAIDKHFCNTPLERNLPVLMGLIGIWNTDFLGADTLAVLPYNESLRYLPAYLQQLEMESNGKTIGRDNQPLACAPNPIVWGEIGINGQHAFFQLLHQGGWLVPADFIAAVRSDYPLPDHQDALLANCFAQSAALAFGRTEPQARAELEAQGLSGEGIDRLLPHKVFRGNQPSTTMLLPKLGPFQLGQLIALYEHKVFVQGVVWGINSFDQWGVELGKQVAGKIQPAFHNESAAASLDASTRRLVEFSRKHL
jgi:glucose-6-phosphate isomerase